MYPEDFAIKTWKNDVASFVIMQHPSLGHYCGYAIFTTKPVQESGYDGLMTYVPVHGGITYAEPRETGEMVYGFDCAHFGDYRNPLLRDMDYLTAECESMALAIVEAAKHEPAYLAAPENGRAVVVDEYHAGLREKNIRFDLQDNFGALINVLVGRV